MGALDSTGSRCLSMDAARGLLELLLQNILHLMPTFLRPGGKKAEVTSTLKDIPQQLISFSCTVMAGEGAGA